MSETAQQKISKLQILYNAEQDARQKVLDEMAMPDDAQFFLCREFSTTGKTMQGYGNDGTVKQLKLLVASWRDLAGRFMC